MKTPKFILGLDEADMKKIRGFRLRLVTLFFPSLIEVLKETATSKATYQKRWLEEEDYARELKVDLYKRNRELKELQDARDKRLSKSKNDHLMEINNHLVALQSEQSKNERLKKEIKALNKTIAKLKGGNDNNKPKADN